MKTALYTATPPNTTFLYPKSRQYPFDEVCEKIVRALEKRNWKVPGIQVEFHDSGTGELKYRHVSKIKGEDFKLWFCRIQGSINAWRNDIAAIKEVVIPKKELHVHEDESGPTFYTYIGDNWEKDKDIFMNGSKSHSKLDGKLKIYLEYTGRCSPLDENGYSGQNYQHSRNPYLVNDDARGREYKACSGESKYFRTHQVFQEINEWLNVNVLERIESIEEVADVELTTEPCIPYPEHVGPFYVKIDQPTYKRILKGKEDKNQLEPSERYALIGGGHSLVPFNVRNDGSVPEEAYNGFKRGKLKRPDLTGDDNCFALLRISPKNAKDLFVADYEPASRQCFEANAKERKLTAEEYDEYQRCRGRTIVPIHEYKGDYEVPVILIDGSRELSLDEVEIVEVKAITKNTKLREG